MLILIEFDLRPIADGKFTSTPAKSGIPGWCALAEEIQRALTLSGVDVTVPGRMGELLHDHGWYDQVFEQHADIPVGFWPKGACLRLGLCTLHLVHPSRRSDPSDRRPTCLDGIRLAYPRRPTSFVVIGPIRERGQDAYRGGTEGLVFSARSYRTQVTRGSRNQKCVSIVQLRHLPHTVISCSPFSYSPSHLYPVTRHHRQSHSYSHTTHRKAVVTSLLPPSTYKGTPSAKPAQVVSEARQSEME